MKKIKLLPNRYKLVGWILLIPSLILGVILLVSDFETVNCTIKLPVLYNSGTLFDSNPNGLFEEATINLVDNLTGILIIVGGLLVGFSKEKVEDEYINTLRLKAVFWSMKINYLIFLLLFLSIFGFVFLSIMFVMVYLPLLLYIFKFNYLLLINRAKDEK